MMKRLITEAAKGRKGKEKYGKVEMGEKEEEKHWGQR